MRQSFLGAFLANKSAREIFQRPLFFYFLPLDVFFGNIKRLETSYFFCTIGHGIHPGGRGGGGCDGRVHFVSSRLVVQSFLLVAPSDHHQPQRNKTQSNAQGLNMTRNDSRTKWRGKIWKKGTDGRIVTWWCKLRTILRATILEKWRGWLRFVVWQRVGPCHVEPIQTTINFLVETQYGKT